jgi:vitamin B12 transporter
MFNRYMPILGGVLLLSQLTFAADFLAPEVVVTATKFPNPATANATEVTVMPGRTLSRLGVQTPHDAIAILPGILPTDAGGQISFASQGLPASQTKVLVDDVVVKDAIATQGQPYLDVLSVYGLDRIEVIEGSYGSVHGPDAIGGVIHFIHNEDRNFVGANAGIGFWQAATQVGTDVWGGRLGVGYAHTDDRTISSLSDTTEIDPRVIDNYRISYRKELGTVSANVILAKNVGHFGLDSAFTSVDDPNYVLNSVQDMAQLKLNYMAGPIQSAFVYSLNAVNRHTENTTDNVDTTSEENATYVGQVNTIETRHLWQVDPSTQLLFGADNRVEIGSSSYTSTSNFGPFSTQFPNQTQTNTGMYMAATNLNEVLSWTAGGRVDFYRNKNVPTVTLSLFRDVPGADAIARLSYRTGHREPSLFERFDGFSGDPTLSAEESNSYQASVEKKIGDVSVKAAYFLHEIRNRIDYNFTTSKYENIPGLTTSKGYQLAAYAQDILWLSWLSTGYTYYDAKTQGSSGVTRSLLVPDHKWTVTAVLTSDPFSLGFTYIEVGQRMDFGNISLPLYRLVNLNAEWAVNSLDSVNIGIHNLFNAQYEEKANYKTLGRLITVGFYHLF